MSQRLLNTIALRRTQLLVADCAKNDWVRLGFEALHRCIADANRSPLQGSVMAADKKGY